MLDQRSFANLILELLHDIHGPPLAAVSGSKSGVTTSMTSIVHP